jgi:drug/metabolite transporter (DMT)-like permease
MVSVRVVMLICAAMIAFAANSVLCRMSLGAGHIDASSFTSIRLLSGTICLLLIVGIRDRSLALGPPRVAGVAALFIYMVGFSFAYRSLSAGTGALLLFGFVQLTMLGIAAYRGERWSVSAWMGMLIAVCGLVYLVLPGVEAPAPLYSMLMATAGIAWGIYSIMGGSGDDPTRSTARNFLYATPLALLASFLDLQQLVISWNGVLLAIASGAIASGIGYAIWYTALKYISASSAAIIQLSVPALATLGGVVLLAEPLSVRIIFATSLIISGIALVITRKTVNAGRRI